MAYFCFFDSFLSLALASCSFSHLLYFKLRLMYT